jgi:hypothetical protein
MASFTGATRLVQKDKRHEVARKPTFAINADYHSNINTSAGNVKAPVVILPGFLQGSKPYQDMQHNFLALGFPTSVMPLNSLEWAPTLYGASFGNPPLCS